ncbi:MULTISPECIES: threonine/serine exporter family protein [Coprobacillaceae]|uniref:threonine/serine exporter family protein n=1 Tax=Coprobacillaceae TaxID=2810280 RepID=UPI000E4A0326|nr:MULTISPECIES: threonine/serine exporter family protein [Coprobacillaceae]RHM60585.1 threonine/serine exporter [Coprobacillus sp. AF33-1AC]RHS93309.1 threonine/serine exporter [Erysipelatoclostridium sp. AM42-17]
MEQIIQCLSAFFACIGFAFVFRIHHHPRFAIIGSLGGSLGWIIYLLTIQSYGDVLANLIAMSCVALYSEIMARLLKAPATIFIIIGCFPLVPGKGIYQTMLYLIQGNNDLFVSSLLNTIAIAFALALAILLVSTLFKVIKVIKTSAKKVSS